MFDNCSPLVLRVWLLDLVQGLLLYHAARPRLCIHLLLIVLALCRTLRVRILDVLVEALNILRYTLYFLINCVALTFGQSALLDLIPSYFVVLYERAGVLFAHLPALILLVDVLEVQRQLLEVRSSLPCLILANLLNWIL